MIRHLSEREASAQFSELVSEVELDGTTVVIEREGRPVAAIVTPDRPEQLKPTSEPSRGLLGLLGAWGDNLTDEEIDALIADIYAARDRDLGRPVEPSE